MMQNVSKLKSLLKLFPLHDEISYSFAYGSAVFAQSLDRNPSNVYSSPDGQSKRSSSNQMVDLILVVNNSLKWHEANLEMNRSHYSELKYLGPSNLVKIQQNFGAKIYYNTLVPVGNDLMIKYGIISREDFINDMLDWETLYLSGRVHKPILVLHQEDESGSYGFEKSQNALKINRQSALHAALLLLPEWFTKEQLFLTIAGLSYSGDFRMWFGEDRSKVEKIVRPQIATFNYIYSPLINKEPLKQLVKWSEESQCYQQDRSNNSIQWHLNSLPKNVQVHIGRHWLVENTSRRYRIPTLVHRFDIDDLMRTVAFDIEYGRYLRQAIQTIVFRSSTMQTIKGFFTAGPTKSVIYSASKIRKMIQSL